MFKSGICLLEELLSGSAHTEIRRANMGGALSWSLVDMLQYVLIETRTHASDIFKEFLLEDPMFFQFQYLSM